MANTTPYSFNIINDEVKDTLFTKPYNKDGAIVFNVDTNKLAINIGNIYDENTKKTNRRILNCNNADYAKNAGNARDANHATYAENAGYADALHTRIKNEGSNTYQTIQVSGTEFYNMIQNCLSKKNSQGTGNATFGTELVSTNNIAGIITGCYNAYANTVDTLFVVGCGTSDTDRKNALTVYKNDTVANNNKSCLVLEGNIYSGNQTQENKLITKSELNTALVNYATKSYVDDKVANVITQPYVVSAEAPTSESDKKLLWINTSKGNGVLNYWNGTTWKEISAVYS